MTRRTAWMLMFGSCILFLGYCVMDDSLEVEEGEEEKASLDGWELSAKQRRFIESLIDEGC